jgi:ligand-binding SRPBCC domain-containing protein
MSARVHMLERTKQVLAAPERVFEFFADAGNLERITPPELRFQILTPRPIVMSEGVRIDYRLSLFRIPFVWKTEITSWRPNQSFVDEQSSGPFGFWHHTHRFEESGVGTRMTDTVRYSLPLSPLSQLAHPVVRRQLESIFDYRGEVIPSEIARHIRNRA